MIQNEQGEYVPSQPAGGMILQDDPRAQRQAQQPQSVMTPAASYMLQNEQGEYVPSQPSGGMIVQSSVPETAWGDYFSGDSSDPLSGGNLGASTDQMLNMIQSSVPQRLAIDTSVKTAPDKYQQRSQAQSTSKGPIQQRSSFADVNENNVSEITLYYLSDKKDDQVLLAADKAANITSPQQKAIGAHLQAVLKKHLPTLQKFFRRSTYSAAGVPMFPAIPVDNPAEMRAFAETLMVLDTVAPHFKGSVTNGPTANTYRAWIAKQQAQQQVARKELAAKEAQPSFWARHGSKVYIGSALLLLAGGAYYLKRRSK